MELAIDFVTDRELVLHSVGKLFALRALNVHVSRTAAFELCAAAQCPLSSRVDYLSGQTACFYYIELYVVVAGIVSFHYVLMCNCCLVVSCVFAYVFKLVIFHGSFQKQTGGGRGKKIRNIFGIADSLKNKGKESVVTLRTPRLS